MKLMGLQYMLCVLLQKPEQALMIYGVRAGIQGTEETSSVV